MGWKRTADEVDSGTPHPQRQPLSKRMRLSPTAEAPSDSSAPSLSEDSALRSSPSASNNHIRNSSTSSLHSVVTEDSESSLSSSSNESFELDTNEEDEVIAIGGPKKPQIAGERVLNRSQELQARISALLPQLAAANQDLETHGAGATMEDVDEGEEHIVMDLGLGVLEEKTRDSDSSSEGESEDVGDATDGEGDVPVLSGVVQRRRGKDLGVIDKLMGKKRDGTKAMIEQMG